MCFWERVHSDVQRPETIRCRQFTLQSKFSLSCRGFLTWDIRQTHVLSPATAITMILPPPKTAGVPSLSSWYTNMYMNPSDPASPGLPPRLDYVLSTGLLPDLLAKAQHECRRLLTANRGEPWLHTWTCTYTYTYAYLQLHTGFLTTFTEEAAKIHISGWAVPQDDTVSWSGTASLSWQGTRRQHRLQPSQDSECA